MKQGSFVKIDVDKVQEAAKDMLKQIEDARNEQLEKAIAKAMAYKILWFKFERTREQAIEYLKK